MTAAFEPAEQTPQSSRPQPWNSSGPPTRAGKASPVTTRPPTSSASAAASPKSTPWPAAVPRSSGSSSPRSTSTGGYTNALGALTGNQAVQQVKAGLRAIYLSGWQVAADANNSGHTYPDQSLYPANSVPTVVRRINNALLRADQIEFSEGIQTVEDWLVPIVADAEAGFGGPLNAYELMKSMIQPAPRAFTGKTSSPRRRSAATSAARSSSPPSSTSAP